MMRYQVLWHWRLPIYWKFIRFKEYESVSGLYLLFDWIVALGCLEIRRKATP